MPVKPPSEEMRRHRADIDALDVEIARLLGQRFDIVKTVAKHKKERGIPAVLPDRIQEVVDHARELGEQNHVDPDLMEGIYRMIIKHACEFEDKVISR